MAVTTLPGENLARAPDFPFDAAADEADHRRCTEQGPQMNTLAELSAPTSKLTPTAYRSRASLFVAIQAVEVAMDIDGVGVRGVIPREVFEYCLDTAPTPEAWLAAFETHRPVFEEIIRRRHRATQSDFVVVRSDDMRIQNERRA
jgi:hypothetical protein